MGDIIGTICIILGIVLCIIATIIFMLAHKEYEEKNKQRAIKVSKTRKKNEKQKQKIIKKTTK